METNMKCCHIEESLKLVIRYSALLSSALCGQRGTGMGTTANPSAHHHPAKPKHPPSMWMTWFNWLDPTTRFTGESNTKITTKMLKRAFSPSLHRVNHTITPIASTSSQKPDTQTNLIVQQTRFLQKSTHQSTVMACSGRITISVKGDFREAKKTSHGCERPGPPSDILPQRSRRTRNKAADPK